MSEVDKNNKKKKYFLPDLPISSQQQDLFRHKDFVDVILFTLEHCETPLNIAIYGQWGVGKSSILGLLNEKITKDNELKKQYQLVYVDAWKLSPDSLKQELLQEFNNEFKVFTEDEIEDRLWNVREEYSEIKTGTKEKIANAIKSTIPYLALFGGILGTGLTVGYFTKTDLVTSSFFSSIVIPVLTAIVLRFKSISNDFVKTSKRIVPRVESSQQFERIFNEMVKRKKSEKLIIAIDNLDRCEDESVVKILGTIKTFMNQKDCVYIIPCDEQAIIRHILAVRGGQFYQEREAIEFLNKFFQITLHIPPYIEGDLESFVDKQISEFDIKFDPSVKDVLILGITRNPRKIRQYLYDLVVLYRLAKTKEDGGVVQKGILTENTGFLAKIIVLRAEWPDFYRRLEQKEDLLELLEKQFFGESSELPPETSTEILSKNDGLEWFLRRTQLVTPINISAALKLNQESYESTMTDLSAFVLKITQGESASVRADLEKIPVKDRERYILEAINRIDNYMLNNRLQFAFNSMNVLLEIYDIIPDELKNEVLSKFSIHMNNPQIRMQLHRLNSSKLFPLILQMTHNNREMLFKHYCREFVRVQDFINSVIPQFIMYQNQLSGGVISEFNLAIRDLMSQNPPAGINAMKLIIKDPNSLTFLIKPEMIAGLLQRISTNSNPDNKNMIDLYLQLQKADSERNKTDFVNRILAIADQDKANAIDANLQFALDVFNQLNYEELPTISASILHEGIKKFIGQMANEPDKIKILTIILKNLKVLEASKKREFLEQQAPQLVSSLSPNFVVLFSTLAIGNEPKELYSDNLANSVISRIQQSGPMGNDVIQFLLTSLPKDKEKVGLDIIRNTLRNHPQATLQIVATVVTKVGSQFSSEFFNQTCRELFEVAKTRPWPEVAPPLDAINGVLDLLSEGNKNILTDILLNWSQSGDPPTFQSGIRYIGNFYQKLSVANQSNIINVLLRRAKTLVMSDPNVRLILDLFARNYDKMSIADRKEIMNFLSSTIDVKSSIFSQTTCLEYIAGMKLNEDEYEILSKILDLYKSTTDGNIKNSCKNALTRLNKYGKSEFWEEVKTTVGTDLRS